MSVEDSIPKCKELPDEDLAGGLLKEPALSTFAEELTLTLFMDKDVTDKIVTMYYAYNISWNGILIILTSTNQLNL